jgi:hypothetical protein
MEHGTARDYVRRILRDIRSAVRRRTAVGRGPLLRWGDQNPCEHAQVIVPGRELLSDGMGDVFDSGPQAVLRPRARLELVDGLPAVDIIGTT